jgi:phospholipid/cholesterol/gamma-HCH transport system substrate-binding protein
VTAKTQIRVRAGVLIAFAVFCLAIFVVLLQIAGGLSLGAKYDFEAVVPTVVQMVPGADVREAGVNVGKVTDISNRGATAVVALALDKRYGPIYRDATVRVRTKTIVGENYLEINPGTRSAGAIPQNGVLPIQQAQDAVQLDQILSTLDATRRARLRQLLDGFGGGLRGASGEVNQTLAALSSTVHAAGPVTQALADQSQQLGTLVGDLGQVLTALGDRAAAIQRLANDGLGAATAIAAQDAAVSRSLRDLPSTLTTAQSATARLAAVGADASPVLDNLGGALTALTPALRALPSAGAATLSALRRLHTVTPVASKLLQALRAIAPTAKSVVRPLDGLVRELGPAIVYLAPYANDAAHLLYMLDSAGSGHDANGELGRIVPLFSSATLSAIAPQLQQALATLQSLGLANALNLKGVNAYPAPGSAAAPGALTSAYPRIQRDSSR